MPHEEIESYYKKSVELLEKCKSDLNNGLLVNLDDFEKSVRGMCDNIAKIPITEALQYQPNLTAISEQLDILSDSIIEKKNEISNQLKNLDRQKMAHIAYTKPAKFNN